MTFNVKIFIRQISSMNCFQYRIRYIFQQNTILPHIYYNTYLVLLPDKQDLTATFQ